MNDECKPRSLEFPIFKGSFDLGGYFQVAFYIRVDALLISNLVDFKKALKLRVYSFAWSRFLLASIFFYFDIGLSFLFK